jgi:hypothetical protein
MDMPQLPDNTKSFWAKKEGTTGMLFIAGALVGLYFLLPVISSFLAMGIDVVGKGITLTILGSILFGLFYVVTDKKFRTIAQVLFKNAMRKFTGLFVEIDPIGIMRSIIDIAKDKQEVFNERKTNLSGSIRQVKGTIEENSRIIKKALEMFAAARKVGPTQEKKAQEESRTAGRYTEFNDRLKVSLGRMEAMYTRLNEYSEVLDSFIKDLSEDVTIKEKERKMMLDSYSAMKAAMSILSGNGDAWEMFNQSAEFLAADYNQKLGEIEDFMSATKSILDGVDLQNGIWEDRAVKQLDALNQKTETFLLPEKKVLIPLERNPLNSEADYAKLYDKRN